MKRFFSFLLIQLLIIAFSFAQEKTKGNDSKYCMAGG